MGNPKKKVEIPEGEFRLPAAENMFESTTLYFGKNPPIAIVCDSRAEAELLAEFVGAGYRGPISIPTTEEGCRNLHQRLKKHLAFARAEFERLARERAGSTRLQAQIVDTLWRWFLYGRPEDVKAAPKTPKPETKKPKKPRNQGTGTTFPRNRQSVAFIETCVTWCPWFLIPKVSDAL